MHAQSLAIDQKAQDVVEVDLGICAFNIFPRQLLHTPNVENANCILSKADKLILLEEKTEESLPGKLGYSQGSFQEIMITILHVTW